MSWIQSTENTLLVNLDHVETISLVEVDAEEGEPEPLFGIAVAFPDEDELTFIFTGTDVECQAKFDAIAAKLPLMKGA